VTLGVHILYNTHRLWKPSSTYSEGWAGRLQ